MQQWTLDKWLCDKRDDDDDDDFLLLASKCLDDCVKQLSCVNVEDNYDGEQRR